MLAQRFLQAHITGIELDPDSAQQAKENAASSPFPHRVQIIHADFLEHTFAEKYDLIASNPPFFKGVFSSGNEKRDRARHEFSLPQKSFLQKATRALKPEGKLAVILSAEEAKQFSRVAEELGFFLNREVAVKGAPNAAVKRYLMEFSFGNTGYFEQSELILRDENRRFSKDYKNLTAEFHPDSAFFE